MRWTPDLLSSGYTLAASWLDRLLGLDESYALGAENTALGWEHPLPGWAWLLIVLAALALSTYSYHRLLGSKTLRILCASLRGVLLIALAVLLAGPTVVRTDVTPEPDWLLVLVDRSASLTFEDMRDGETMVTRDAALRAALARQGDLFGDERLGKGRNIVWLGFDRDAYPITPPPELLAGVDVGEGSATGVSTPRAARRTLAARAAAGDEPAHRDRPGDAARRGPSGVGHCRLHRCAVASAHGRAVHREARTPRISGLRRAAGFGPATPRPRDRPGRPAPHRVRWRPRPRGRHRPPPGSRARRRGRRGHRPGRRCC